MKVLNRPGYKRAMRRLRRDVRQLARLSAKYKRAEMERTKRNERRENQMIKDERWNKQKRVHFETVNEPADYRGNVMPHTYLVVDGLRVAATKADWPSASLVEMFERESAERM